jgi:serine/threonine-protein kinase
MAAEAHLLLGLLALQNGLIQPPHLVAAFHAWTGDKARSLSDHLIALGHLSDAQRSVLEALAELHVAAHCGDVGKSLAAVPVGTSTRERLTELGDPDIEATLGHVPSGDDSTADGDTDRTASHGAGTASSDGQRFRILRPHARGGLGYVFVALDQELHREVALKQILDQHADDPASRHRFLLEAEVTGGLEHPGIVPVYALGTYGDGRPFYAMRFIRGDSLKEGIDRFRADDGLKKDPGGRSLQLRKLLRRFTDVCNAIDYAHSRAVIHRDIKPANIILGKHGETLVVDWGLAKALGRTEPGLDSGERMLIPTSGSGSAETLPGSALGTPAYMSPEQAEGDLEHLGPRSDIYSLGATLYYLITGRPPVEGELGEVLRAVQRGEFPPPRQHDSSIDRALEAICLKAMAHQPADRYATARALAEDVERWMADEPVSAWNEPWIRTLTRSLTRHRTGVTAAGAAVLVALAGCGAVLAVQTRANAALKRANVDLAIASQNVTRANAGLEAANARERQRFDLAMEAVKLFHGEVSEDLLLKEKPFAALRSRLLTGAADFYGKLERLLEGQTDPASRAALARAYHDLGKLTFDIGKSAETLSLYRKALAVRRELAGRPGADDAAVLGLVRALYTLAIQLESTGDAAASTATFEEALRLAEGLVAAGRGADEAHFELARCAQMLGYKLSGRRLDEGLPMAQRALAIFRDLVARAPSESRYVEELGTCHLIMGAILSGRPVESLASLQEAVAIYRKLADAQPGVYRFLDELGRVHNNIAGAQSALGQRDAAIASQGRALAYWREAYEANPAVTILANNVAFGLHDLALDLIQAGRPAEALVLLAEARLILKKLLADDEGYTSYAGNLATNAIDTGRALARMGMRREAGGAFAEAAVTLQRLVQKHPASVAILGNLYGSLGWALWEDGRPAEAVTAFNRGRPAEARGATCADRETLAEFETNAALALVAVGRPAEARACCDRAITIREGLVKESPANASFATGLATSLLRSGHARAAAGNLAGAAADWRRAGALFAAHPPEGKHAIFRACCHGALAGLAGKADSGITASEASRQAEDAMAILRRAIAAGNNGIDLIPVEPGLDPLRSRDDFRRLMSDLAFPDDPFAYRVDQEYRPVPAPLVRTAPAAKL